MAASAGWDKQFAVLVAYKAKHGDCDVPSGFEEDRRLATWVSTGKSLAPPPRSLPRTNLWVKVTGLAQKLGQLEVVNRDLQSKSWANFWANPVTFTLLHSRRELFGLFGLLGLCERVEMLEPGAVGTVEPRLYGLSCLSCFLCLSCLTVWTV